MAVGPITILVNGQAPQNVIDILGNGIAYVKITITAQGQPNTAWKITTTDALVPFDAVNGITDANAQAEVYLGPSRVKGDFEFKIKVGTRTLAQTVRFSN